MPLDCDNEIDEASIENAIHPAKDVDGYRICLPVFDSYFVLHQFQWHKCRKTIQEGKRIARIDPLYPKRSNAYAENYWYRGYVWFLVSHGIDEGTEIRGKMAVVVGRSDIVGRPMAELLLKSDATVITCHSRTTNLQEVVKTADIVVAGVGRPQMIKKVLID